MRHMVLSSRAPLIQPLLRYARASAPVAAVRARVCWGHLRCGHGWLALLRLGGPDRKGRVYFLPLADPFSPYYLPI